MIQLLKILTLLGIILIGAFMINEGEVVLGATAVTAGIVCLRYAILDFNINKK